MIIPGNIWTSKKANIDGSRPVNLYLLNAYPAGIAITKPSRLVPIDTISEFLNQIQTDSPSRIFLKCSLLNESPISPPSALPGDKAISRIQMIGIRVITTKCSSVIWEPNVLCWGWIFEFLSRPYSTALIESSLLDQTDTALLDSKNSEIIPGAINQRLIQMLNIEYGIKINGWVI